MDGGPAPRGFGFGIGSGPGASRRWVAHGRHDVLSRPRRSVGEGPSPELRLVSTSSSGRMIELDGSRGEGGGQILRTALSLSLITGKPFRITRIRANRDVPGLRPQHAAAVEAAAKLGSAEVRGGAIGSKELTFRPGEVSAADFTHDIGTAGSTALVLQTIALPIALKAVKAVRVSLKGGTFNLAAPSFPFLETCWRAHLAGLGVSIGLTMPAAGFYPQGGGRVEAWIEPARPKSRTIRDRGPLQAVRGEAGVCRLGRGAVAERMRDRAVALLADRGIEAEVRLVEWDGPAPGAALSLTADHEHTRASFVGLGARGKPAEAVAAEAVAQLLAFEDAQGAVDPHSADQLLLPLALAEGPSEYTVTEVTEHLRTNVHTIRAFLDREIRVVEDDGGGGRVVIRD